MSLMADIYLFNSLTRKKEIFEPINSPNVGMYTCGPTVYDYATIGNFRSYLTADILYRSLQFFGYQVTYIMNLTDVGHLTGDNLGDADLGKDRVEESAKIQGKTAWDIAKFYTEAFLKDFEALNMKLPKVFSKATDHITEQIELIKRLEVNGLTYKINDGIYFDTTQFEKTTGKKYGELSDLDKIKEGARVEVNPEKKNARDFALWKFSPKDVKRQMEWESPWGTGFPGWHIECSAMSMKYLGEGFDPFGKFRVNGEQSRTIDIHTGGEDLRQTHHPNEIAQAEGATGKPFVKYWLHTTFLQVDGKRMGKSLGNAYTLTDIEKKGYEPLALRYLFLNTHYKEPLNFTWDSLTSASTTLVKLREYTISFRDSNRTILSNEKGQKIEHFEEAFRKAIGDDLNTPRALAVLWEGLKSNIPSEDKYDMALSFDEVLGLGLNKISQVKLIIPEEINKLVAQRESLRKEGRFEDADEIRKTIEKLGFEIKDTSGGTIIKKS